MIERMCGGWGQQGRENVRGREERVERKVGGGVMRGMEERAARQSDGEVREKWKRKEDRR